ncbi:MAG: beta galactosidase jelly roll domain-containing protein, partial [Clostridia bacterium]|nr:beta galactosidase jelly roll domain-containing protein [Clostridia bacterium]
MTIINLNRGWKFHLGDEENSFETRHRDEEWQNVTIPHDWSVAYPKSREFSSGTGYVIGGTAWYRKAFALEETDAGHPFFLCFDGVYKNSQVWVNGYYLGRRPNGYISFRYDVTDYLYFDGRDNIIAVKVTHEDIADSRWFTGSGIHRKVTLVRYDFV